MARRIRLQAKDLPRAIRQRNKATKRAIAHGALRGAERGRTIIARKTPKSSGQLKGAWRARPGRLSRFRRTSVIATLVNNAPHASVVERGAKPHPVGPEGVKALTEWVWKNRGKFGLVTASGRLSRSKKARERANAIALRIAWKIRQKRQTGTFFVKKNRPAIERAGFREVKRALRRSARRRVER